MSMLKKYLKANGISADMLADRVMEQGALPRFGCAECIGLPGKFKYRHFIDFFGDNDYLLFEDDEEWGVHGKDADPYRWLDQSPKRTMPKQGALHNQKLRVSL